MGLVSGKKILSKNGVRCQKSKNFREQVLVKGLLVKSPNLPHSLTLPWLNPEHNDKPL